MDKMVKSIIALCALVSIIFSVYFYSENRYAKASDLKKIENRIDYKIVSDQIMSINERLWKIEDRFGDTPKDKTIKEEVRTLKESKELLNKKLEILQEKSINE